jgi:hypothetical protein
MRKHIELFEEVRRRPGMYFLEDNFDVVAAFVLGCDLANEGGILAGFREWLVVRLGHSSNLAWRSLVLDFAFPDASNPEAELARGVENHRRAIRTLWSLLSEFEIAREERSALRKIFVAFDRLEGGEEPESPRSR